MTSLADEIWSDDRFTVTLTDAPDLFYATTVHDSKTGACRDTGMTAYRSPSAETLQMLADMGFPPRLSGPAYTEAMVRQMHREWSLRRAASVVDMHMAFGQFANLRTGGCMAPDQPTIAGPIAMAFLGCITAATLAAATL